MQTLDLHGIKHYKVELIVENFILLNDFPLRIITGNSPTMKNIVAAVVKKHGFQFQIENHVNLGSLIIFNGN